MPERPGTASAWVRGLALSLAIASIASSLQAQQRASAAAGAPRFATACAVTPMDPRALCPTTQSMSAQASAATAPPAGWSILASAILPGSGQAMLGVNRALPFLALEAFAWTSYVTHSVEYRRDRDGYRDLASRVARAPYSSVRPPGNFEYYERMTHFPEAGRYDLVAGGGLDPETDSTTYNGAVWLLARRTYWSDPSVPPDTASVEWGRAVAFYRARAYDQLFRWSWTHAPLEYSAFIDLIHQSNDANRRALQDLGVIIANHVLSTVDAYIVVRLRRQADAQGFALEGSIPLARFSSGSAIRSR